MSGDAAERGKARAALTANTGADRFIPSSFSRPGGRLRNGQAHG